MNLLTALRIVLLGLLLCCFPSCTVVSDMDEGADGIQPGDMVAFTKGVDGDSELFGNMHLSAEHLLYWFVGEKDDAVTFRTLHMGPAGDKYRDYQRAFSASDINIPRSKIAWIKRRKTQFVMPEKGKFRSFGGEYLEHPWEQNERADDIKTGDMVIFTEQDGGGSKLLGHMSLSPAQQLYWFVGEKNDTVTFRTLHMGPAGDEYRDYQRAFSASDLNIPRSRIEWIKRHKTQFVMPEKGKFRSVGVEYIEYPWE